MQPRDVYDSFARARGLDPQHVGGRSLDALRVEIDEAVAVAIDMAIAALMPARYAIALPLQQPDIAAPRGAS
jgi:hypothetical protein